MDETIISLGWGRYFPMPENRNPRWTRKDYLYYLEDLYEEYFPRKGGIFSLVYNKRKEKDLKRIEKMSYEYYYEKGLSNFVVPGGKGLLRLAYRAIKDNRIVSGLKSVKNSFVNFFKGKDDEEFFEEEYTNGFISNPERRLNRNKKIETAVDEEITENFKKEDIIEIKETIEEEISENFKEEDKIIIPEIVEENENVEEKIEEEEIDKMMPIQIKEEKKDTNIEKVRDELAVLNKQISNQQVVIESILKNLNVYEVEIMRLKEENLKLKRELNLKTYNPNSFVIMDAYEKAVKEDQYRKMMQVEKMMQADLLKDDLSANPFYIEKVKVKK